MNKDTRVNYNEFPLRYNHILLILSRRETYQCVVEVLNLLIKPVSMYYQGNMFSRFPSNSEAFASELQANFEEMFPWYHMHSNKFSISTLLTTQ